MRIYFAGNTLVRERERLLIDQNCPRLFSYYHHRPGGMADQDFKAWVDDEDIFCRGVGQEVTVLKCLDIGKPYLDSRFSVNVRRET